MATYDWHYNDNDDQVNDGIKNEFDTGAIKVIQQNDGRGGYNVEFPMKGRVSVYHIHFQIGAKKVHAVRHKVDRGSANSGENITEYHTEKNNGFGPNRKENLKTLATHLRERNYPNHATLFDNLHDAWNKAGNPGAPKDEL